MVLSFEYLVNKITWFRCYAPRLQESHDFVDTRLVECLILEKLVRISIARQPDHVRTHVFGREFLEHGYQPVAASTYSFTSRRFSMEPSNRSSIGTWPSSVDCDSLSQLFSSASSLSHANSAIRI